MIIVKDAKKTFDKIEVIQDFKDKTNWELKCTCLTQERITIWKHQLVIYLTGKQYKKKLPTLTLTFNLVLELLINAIRQEK